MSLGYYRVSVGDYVCTVINEGTFPPDDEWIQDTFCAPEGLNLLALKAEYEINHGPFHFGMSPLLIEADERAILVDSGLGHQAPEPLREMVIKQLEKIGVQPETIDTIIISHLDEDHFMGTIDENGDLRFPNAQIMIGERELLMRGRPDLKAPPQYEKFHDLKGRQDYLSTIGYRIQQVNPGDEIAAGVTMVHAYGHRPGQLGVLVESNGEGFLYIADAAHTPIQFKVPTLDIAVQYDHGMALQTRLDLFGKAADEDLIVMAYHFGFPCVGKVQRNEDVFQWQPVVIEREEPDATETTEEEVSE